MGASLSIGELPHDLGEGNDLGGAGDIDGCANCGPCRIVVVGEKDRLELPASDDRYGLCFAHVRGRGRLARFAHLFRDDSRVDEFGRSRSNRLVENVRPVGHSLQAPHLGTFSALTCE